MTIERDWITAAGLRAVVYFIDDMGHRCGYVAVPEGHPLFGVDYNDAKPVELDEDGDGWFKVHGGLTYSDGSSTYPVEATDVWWFGYDCTHAWDAPAPGSKREADDIRFGFGSEDRTHRTLEFCVAQCESLATQLQAPEIKAREDAKAAKDRLDAAGPELLSALADLLARAEKEFADPEDLAEVQAAKAAVAKATGGAA